MKYQIFFIFVSSMFVINNGFTLARAHVSRKSGSTRRRIEREELERKQRDEIKQKCNYLNQQFPIESNTCPKMIVDNYKILYSPTYYLLQYQYANCFVNPIVYPFWQICLTWFLIILFGIGLSMTP
jgi:hypothetical protein